MLRELDPHAQNYTGLSHHYLDFRDSSNNQVYVDQYRLLRNITGLHRYLGEPEQVRARLYMGHFIVLVDSATDATDPKTSLSLLVLGLWAPR